LDWQDAAGDWANTLYDWEGDHLVGQSYVSRYDSWTATWSYDEAGRVAEWWTDEGGVEKGEVTYVGDTQRPAVERVDQAGEDGVLDGVPDLEVVDAWGESGGS
jgi:hypothetical protein